MSALFVILASLRMTLFSKKVLIYNICISGLLSNLTKKSWTDSNTNCTFLPKLDEADDEMIEIDIRVLERLDDLEKENQDLKNQINELEKFLASQSGDLQNINDDLIEFMELTIQPEFKNEFGKY